MKTMIPLSLLLLVSSLLAGCGAVVIGGTATGANVAQDRRSTGAVLDDQNLEMASFKLFGDHPEINDVSNISVTSYNYRVLLTGQTEDSAVAARFATMVAELPKVRQVFNEVIEAPENSWSDAISDSYLTTKVKLALFEIELPKFNPTRIKVVTSGSTVYLMGLVNTEEGNAVAEKARYIGGVQRVVKLFEYVSLPAAE